MLKNILLSLLDFFKWALILRILVDYIRILGRNWRPPTFLIAVFEIIYTLTEKPMSYVRRFVPPLQFGGIGIDLSVLVIFFAITFARNFVNLAL